MSGGTVPGPPAGGGGTGAEGGGAALATGAALLGRNICTWQIEDAAESTTRSHPMNCTVLPPMSSPDAHELGLRAPPARERGDRPRRIARRRDDDERFEAVARRRVFVMLEVDHFRRAGLVRGSGRIERLGRDRVERIPVEDETRARRVIIRAAASGLRPASAGEAGGPTSACSSTPKLAPTSCVIPAAWK